MGVSRPVLSGLAMEVFWAKRMTGRSIDKALRSFDTWPMKSEPPTPTRAPDDQCRQIQYWLKYIRNTSLLNVWGWGQGFLFHQWISLPPGIAESHCQWHDARGCAQIFVVSALPHAFIATVSGFHGSEPEQRAGREIIQTPRKAEGHTIRYGCAPICPQRKRDHCIGVCIGYASGYALGYASSWSPVLSNRVSGGSARAHTMTFVQTDTGYP